MRSDNGLILDILVDFMGKYGSYNDFRSQVRFDCPLCAHEKGLMGGDNKYNLEVNLDKQLYNCWSCSPEYHNHGTLTKMINKFGNKKHMERFLLIQPERRVYNKNIKLVDVKIPREFKEFEKKDEGLLTYKQAFKYLKRRGIDQKMIEEYGIGYCIQGDYMGRIMIPSFNNMGIVDYFISRAYDGNRMKYKNPDRPKETIIFNEGKISWNSTIYLVEGVFDSLVVPNSIPMLGKKISDLLVRRILTLSNSSIVILLDGDAFENTKSIYRQLDAGRLRGRIRYIKMPTKLDISDVHKKYGNKGILKILRRSKRFKDSFF